MTEARYKAESQEHEESQESEEPEESESQESQKRWYVYLLAAYKPNSENIIATYVGATVDLNHRLRQHNKEIKGGAHATSARVAQGCTWKRHCYVQGFPTWRAALQFEWRWKQITRRTTRGLPLERRINALHELLSLEKPTTAAEKYSDWPTPPEIVWE